MVQRQRATTENKEKMETQGAAPDPNEALSKALEIFNEDWGKLNLRGKIAAISGHLGRIPKNGFNRFNSYSYVLESDLVEAVRFYLSAARILVFPKRFVEHTVYTFTEHSLAQGERRRDILTDNIIEYEVYDGLTAESFTFEVNGQGSDPRDKGSNKASTSAMKFAYMRLFNISSGEDAESDEQADQKAAASAPRAETPVIKDGTVKDAERGGKQANATSTQIKAVSNLSNQLDLGATGLVGVIERVLETKVELPEDEKLHGPTLAAFLQSQTGENAGKLIYALQQMTKAAAAPDDEEPSGDPYP